MATRNIDKLPKFQQFSHSLSLSLYIFEAISPYSVASFFLSLSVILWYYCSSVRLVRFLAEWLHSFFVCVNVCVVFGALGGWGDVWFVLWGSCCGRLVGYASRRAMLQQLHGVTMYSHDEHHSTTPYCWSERGKGASATNPSTAVLLINIRTSVRHSVCQSVMWPCFV